MRRFIEIHLIQNFAPSNLNRDDTGAPKDAIFGGFRRARVSSQCLKRAMRLFAHENLLVAPEHQGVRTKKLRLVLEEKLAARDRTEAGQRIEAALASAGLQLKEDGKTQYLLFLGNAEIEAFADLVDRRWDELSSGDKTAGEKKSKKDAKADASPELARAAKAILNGGKAVDIALFGRMLADLPAVNQDAACQVAHAISTHRVERDFDYFTAVDDMGAADETGAGMIGQIEFNSATFYRYAVIDYEKLTANLHGDRELAQAALKAFVQASARALPTGKQNTFAAHNPPAFVGVSLRHAGPMNLANAFEKPVRENRDSPLTSLSVGELAAHEEKLAAAFADPRDRWGFWDMTEAWPEGKGERHASVDALTNWVAAQVA